MILTADQIRQIAQIVEDLASSIPATVLLGIAWAESSWRIDARNPASTARGLWQFVEWSWNRAKELARKRGLTISDDFTLVDQTIAAIVWAEALKEELKALPPGILTRNLDDDELLCLLWHFGFKSVKELNDKTGDLYRVLPADVILYLKNYHVGKEKAINFFGEEAQRWLCRAQMRFTNRL